MANRKQHLESIMRSMHIVRLELVKQIFAKAAKPGNVRSPFKSGQAPISPSQWAILAVVMGKENVGIKDIAKELHTTSSAVTQLVDELVNKGFLTRQGNMDDRRALSLKLSERHRKRIYVMRAKSMKRLGVIFDNLTDGEMAQYAALSKKIADGILDKKH